MVEWVSYFGVGYTLTPTANNSLIGIQFLEKFSDVYWSLKQNKLIFYK